jgi:hypothetical protein
VQCYTEGFLILEIHVRKKSQKSVIANLDVSFALFQIPVNNVLTNEQTLKNRFLVKEEGRSFSICSSRRNVGR